MTDREEIESTIKKVIEEFVADHWAKTQSACYLSSIGIYLNHMAPESRVALSSGLREFLRQNPVVEVVQFPEVEQKIGAVPLSASLPDDVRELFARQKLTIFSQNRNIYLKDFWDAFIRPIEEFPRYVLVDETNGVTVRDGSSDGEIHKVYEIRPQDLTTSHPNGSIADKVNATHSAIDEWLKQHSLDPNVFLRARRRKQDFAIGDHLVKFFSSFDSLSYEDLARIKIPLDILFKLNSKK